MANENYDIDTIDRAHEGEEEERTMTDAMEMMGRENDSGDEMMEDGGHEDEEEY